MKRFRRLVLILMACIACALCGLAAFTGCTQADPEEEKNVLSPTNDRLDRTEKQLTYKTPSMVGCNVTTAYENGWLTKTDLAFAMYYACGKVYTCDEADWKKNNHKAIKEIDFIPDVQCPEIDKQVELDIKKLEYESLTRNGHYSNLSFEEFARNYSFRFVGSYNGAFVITDIRSAYWEYPTDVPPPIWIAGFVWYGSYARNLLVFRYE